MILDFKGFINENKSEAEQLEFLHQQGLLDDRDYYKRMYDLAPLDVKALAQQVKTESLDFDSIPKVWVGGTYGSWMINIGDGPVYEILDQWTSQDGDSYDWLGAITAFFEKSIEIGGPYGIVWNEEDEWLAVRDPKSKYGVRLISSDDKFIEDAWFETM